MNISRRAFLETTAAAMAATTIVSAQQPTGKKLRACIIGDTTHGGYGHDLHLVWSIWNEVEIVAVSDPDEAGRIERAKQVGAPRSYADYHEMLDKEKPDIVTVCPRHPVNHRDYVLAAAACGAHGFIEKPLAMDLLEADQMFQAVSEKGLKWAIAFNWRTVPIVQHALKLVKEGIIGQVIELRGRGKEDKRAGGEDLVVLGTHNFDMMRAFAGNPNWCAATITMDGRLAVPSDIREATESLGPIIGDSINATLGFGNGITGHFNSVKTPAGNTGRWGLDVLGTGGIVSLRLDGDGIPVVKLLRSPKWMPDPDKGIVWEALPDAPVTAYSNPSADRYAPITGDLLAAIRENREPNASLQDGRAALEMVSAVFAAHMSGTRVDFPLKDRKHPLSCGA